MHLLLVGISHKTAPVDVRERVDFTGKLVMGLDEDDVRKQIAEDEANNSSQ